MKRGQTLSYDAIGATVIFMLAVGLLINNWMAEDSNRYQYEMMEMAQRGIDKVVEQIKIDEYRLDTNKLANCKIDFSKAGITTSYRLTIIDESGEKYRCEKGTIDENKRGIAERVYMIEENSKEIPVTVRLEISN